MILCERGLHFSCFQNDERGIFIARAHVHVILGILIHMPFYMSLIGVFPHPTSQFWTVYMHSIDFAMSFVSLYPYITLLSLDTCHYSLSIFKWFLRWLILPKICLFNNEFIDLIFCTVSHRPGMNQISSQSCNYMLHWNTSCVVVNKLGSCHPTVLL